MTIPAEPMYIGDQAVIVKFYAMPREIGEPPRVEGVLTVVGGEGALTLDALIGPPGNPGQPSPIIRPQWGSAVAIPGDLPNVATLDDSDDGRAWYIAGSWHVYFDGAYHVIQGSIPGPPGATPNLSITAEQIEVEDGNTYGPIDVVETGTALNPNFHIKVPGIPGPAGPSAAIKTASDFDNTPAIADGQILRYRTSDSKFYGADPDFLAPQLYTIPHNSFVEHTGSEGRFLIAKLDIPAKTFPWYPDVAGHVRLQRSGILSSVQCEVEVRIGDTGVGTGETDQLCGLAPYDPTIALLDSATIAHIAPHWSDTSNPSFALAPGTGAGRVPAGQAKTIYVFIHKIAGSGSYQFTKNYAQLRVYVVPQA